jgi:predicted solute-binding protein
VNNYSIDLGEDGKEAVKKLLTVYSQVNPSTTLPATENLFVAC